MSWNPPKKYKGHRTPYVHAIKIHIPYPSEMWNLNVKLADMEQWCEDNCQNNWSNFGFSTWYFDKPQEAVMFKMIFGGR